MCRNVDGMLFAKKILLPEDSVAVSCHGKYIVIVTKS